MKWVKLYLCFIVPLVTSSRAENKETADSSQDNKEKSSRSPRISSEFGYNIQNSDRISNQFRQEQRDPDGVVRGSYGFKNPDGAFRLVHYVADDKGFRAHISSNERGVGKQNPSSISINRFEHHPGITEDINDFKPPISPQRKQIYANGDLRTEAQLPRYDLYSPIQTSLKSYQNTEVSHLDGRNYDRYDAPRQTFYSSRQNPVDKLINARFPGVPGESLSPVSAKERDDLLAGAPFWKSSPITKVPFPDPVAQHYNEKFYPKTLLHSMLLRDNDYENHRSKVRESSNYTPFLANLLQSPQHKVHTSLPDCNSVSSAVLCKPPSFFRQSVSQQRHSESDEEFARDEVLRASDVNPFHPEEISTKDPTFSNLYDLLDEENRATSPHFIPNSYPVRSETYRNFFNYMQEHTKSLKKNKDCHKHQDFSGTSPRDYFTPVGPYDAVGNDLIQSDLKKEEGVYFDDARKNPQENIHRDQEFYSSLMRVIQNDESLNKLKNLIFKPRESSTDSNSETDTPKLSLLGVLILPSHILKELDRNQVGKTDTKKTPEKVDEKNLVVFGDDIFESDIVDESQSLEGSRNLHEFDSEANMNFSSVTYENPKTSGNKTEFDISYHLPSTGNDTLHTFHYDTNDTESTDETMNNSKFHIFDDQELFDKDADDYKHQSNSSVENWRKILEDEISKEIRTSLQQDLSLKEISEDVAQPEEAIQSNVHRYGFNKHIGPLYDSTGKLIQPENVPIHIHRFNPPSSLTSIPWKYSIPRPAPPRSIVVPPKPPVMS